MYAIVESGGKQYKVEKGESLLVDRLSAKEGDKVGLRPVMFRDGDVITDATELEKVKVEATVAEHLRGPKIRITKYKAKKGYRRRAGYRSELTRIEVTEIKKLTRKPAAKKPAASTTAKKPAASTRKAGTTRKATTRKSTTTRKTPTRKSTSKKESSDGS
jgi:large subunit ribosomal protein L21